MGYFKKTNAFQVYAICSNETLHEKWCLHKSVRQSENDSERSFVEHWLNSAEITGPETLSSLHGNLVQLSFP